MKDCCYRYSNPLPDESASSDSYSDEEMARRDEEMDVGPARREPDMCTDVLPG